MRTFNRRNAVLTIVLTVIVFWTVAEENNSVSKQFDHDLYALGVSHWDGVQRNADGEWEEAYGFEVFRQRIETSKKSHYQNFQFTG